MILGFRIRRRRDGVELDPPELIAIPRALLGSTATEVAEKAHCPVAVIRSQPDQAGPRHQLDRGSYRRLARTRSRDRSGDERSRAAQASGAGHRTDRSEASAHELGNRLEPWRRWYPDVRIYPVTTRDGVTHFVKHNDDLVPLAVIGGADAGQLAQIVSPSDHPIFRHPQSSVLIIRE